MAIVARLLLLVSVLLMPLGMGTAAASAPPADHHAAMAARMEHCPDQPSKHQPSDGTASCSMACASALPAQDVARDDRIRRHRQLVAPLTGPMLTSLQPETATPPPKLA